VRGKEQGIGGAREAQEEESGDMRHERKRAGDRRRKRKRNWGI
jgi:hypothetical protein